MRIQTGESSEKELVDALRRIRYSSKHESRSGQAEC